MYKVEYSKNTRLNLKEIFDFISDDDYLEAIKVVNSIKNTVNFLKDFPLLWTNYLDSTRRLVNSEYKINIFYKINKKKKTIIITSIFKNRY